MPAGAGAATGSVQNYQLSLLNRLSLIIGHRSSAYYVPAGSVEQVALEIAVLDAEVVALALLATDYRIEAVRHRLALVAVLAGHVRRTYALARVGLARGGRRTVARLAVREPEVPRLARLASPPDHVGLALALAAERVAQEAQRAVRVAAARRRSAVVRGRQRERGLLAET